MGQRRTIYPIFYRRSPPLDVVVLDGFEVELDQEGLLRSMGYPAGVTPPPDIEEQVARAIESSRGHVRPRATYSLYQVTRCDKRSLTLAGGATFRGAIGRYLEGSRYAAVFLATAGEEIVEFAERTFRAGDSLAGFILGAIGSRVAEGAVEATVAHLRSCLLPGDSVTDRYSPGYCGMNLQQQRLIFDLVEPDSVGVELLPSLLMKPVKSVSGLVGVGATDDIQTSSSACDRCPALDCSMRR